MMDSNQLLSSRRDAEIFQKALEDKFTVTQLRSICNALGVDYLALGGDGANKRDLSSKLVNLSIRSGQVQGLANTCQAVSPFFQWDELGTNLSRHRSVLQEYEQYRKLSVFLCHQEEDKPTVRILYNKLKSDGFEPWFDEKDLFGGQKYEYWINEAIQSVDVVVVCLSKAINRESYIRIEIQAALKRNAKQPISWIFLIPLLLEPLERLYIPVNIRDYQSINYFNNDGYQRLLKALNESAKMLHLNS